MDPLFWRCSCPPLYCLQLPRRLGNASLCTLPPRPIPTAPPTWLCRPAPRTSPGSSHLLLAFFQHLVTSGHPLPGTSPCPYPLLCLVSPSVLLHWRGTLTSPTPQAWAESLTLSVRCCHFGKPSNQVKGDYEGPFGLRAVKTTHLFPGRLFNVFHELDPKDKNVTFLMVLLNLTLWYWNHYFIVNSHCNRSDCIPSVWQRLTPILAHFYPNTLLAGVCNFSGPVTTEWSDNLIRKVEMKFEW